MRTYKRGKNVYKLLFWESNLDKALIEHVGKNEVYLVEIWDKYSPQYSISGVILNREATTFWLNKNKWIVDRVHSDDIIGENLLPVRKEIVDIVHKERGMK